MGRLIAILSAVALFSGCATSETPEAPPVEAPIELADEPEPQRPFYERLMFGPPHLKMGQRKLWSATVGVATIPIWGIPFTIDAIERGVASGRVLSRPTRALDPVGAPPPDPNFDFGHYQALVVGNREYQYLPDLATPVNDAESVPALLRDLYGFRTTTLRDATRSQLLGELARLRRELSPADNLLIYYAGHGLLDDETSAGYWMPVDAELDDPTNWLATGTITTMIKGMRAKHVLVVADSCYAGSMNRAVASRLRTQNYIYKLAKKTARVVMTSGGVEPVQDAGGGENSIFARHFLRSLRENQEPILEANDLFPKIRRPVMENARQTPEYGPIHLAGHDGGDFLFVRRLAPAE